MQPAPPDSFHPADRKAWRKWLEKNHATRVSVWVIFTKKTKDGVRGLSWSDAVDEALCFGWIDSRARPLDEERYMQFFSRRKPKSVWSKINKDKIERLIADGLMSDAGLQTIEIAKANGSWSSLDHVEDMIIPKDLESAFRKVKGSKAYFEGMGKSIRKAILQWIAMAKLAETRQRRINEVVESAGKGERPKPFRSS